MKRQKLLRFHLKCILIYVSKMYESLKGLKRHEAERMMAEFSVLCELSLNSLGKHF